jgi:hypothetical protein
MAIATLADCATSSAYTTGTKKIPNAGDTGATIQNLKSIIFTFLPNILIP